MNFLLVDDEFSSLHVLINAVSEAEPKAKLFSYTYPEEALEFIKKNKIDVAFLDINMPGINGLDLAVQIKNLYPKCHLIFCT